MIDKREREGSNNVNKGNGTQSNEVNNKGNGLTVNGNVNGLLILGDGDNNIGAPPKPKKITKYSGNGVTMDSDGNVTSCSENFQAEIEEY